ncbi:MAG: tRNA (N(6)-L-threonylcarbamoyladenosine(37)-C(2))-methylthiotransferase MtaB [Peptostreptococcaceae bacterium]|nr:tRNA (N(6)-L-threonylcarbamoyladenosine(37)-C(2))-methylthiotransferase MtaB [Peptostreptococcaceae bacterium]MDY5738423.1 tRNA (N(6)-L-threonylcarbamoyladenosine(37)-C(2))-methylthiotransferase MtaB [Anaerovoracaceae bacterium]
MKIAFHTLGCKVNQYETEAMKEKFSAMGHEIVGEQDFAHVYVINTCTVTNLADRKSRQYIRKMKRVNPESLVVVTGCYAQVAPDEVAEIEGVGLVVGTGEKSQIPIYVEEMLGDNSAEAVCHVRDYKDLKEYESDGIITSMESRTRAYIKIEEGCNRFCSYCIIPYARGQVRSRDMEEIAEEAEGLISAGFKELILTGINTALYGTDLGLGGIAPLIGRLNSIEGNFRIRLSSLEPTVIDAEYVKKLFAYPKLCHHLHLSIQSGSNKILKYMNRRYTREEYLEIVENLRAFDPLYGVTTDIIVGFPGEDDADFADSLRITEEAAFCKVHGFKYSKRKGTAAALMTGQVRAEISKMRMDELEEAARKSEERFFDANKGMEARVLLEEAGEDGMLRGYSDNYIRVYVEGNPTMLNDFCQVVLVEKYKDGMKGELKNE